MTQEARELIVVRTLPADADRVFRAFLEPDQLVRWLGPRGSALVGCEVDARVGGRFRFQLAFDGGGAVVLSGVYRELAPVQRLAFSWGIEGEGDDSEVLVELSPVEGGTALRLEHRGLSPDEIAQNKGGWNEFFDRLVAALR